MVFTQFIVNTQITERSFRPYRIWKGRLQGTKNSVFIRWPWKLVTLMKNDGIIIGGGGRPKGALTPNWNSIDYLPEMSLLVHEDGDDKPLSVHWFDPSKSPNRQEKHDQIFKTTISLYPPCIDILRTSLCHRQPQLFACFHHPKPGRCYRLRAVSPRWNSQWAEYTTYIFPERALYSPFTDWSSPMVSHIFTVRLDFISVCCRTWYFRRCAPVPVMSADAQ